MEDQLIKLRRNVRLCAVVVIVAFGGLIISNRITYIRAVDFLQIFAAGIAFGALLVNLMTIRRIKNKSNL